MIIIIILILLFLIGFISDIILQYLGTKNKKINLFKPYWDYYGKFNAAIVAGIISMVFGMFFLLISIGLYKLIYSSSVYSLSFVIFSSIMAFILGIIFDILCNYNNWFGKIFRNWYDEMGVINASLWSGGLTFSFLNISTLLITSILIRKK